MFSLSHLRRRAGAAAIGVVAIATAACSDDAIAPPPAASAAAPTSRISAANLGKVGEFHPIVDGVISAGEYDSAATVSFRVKVPTPDGATPATVYITHDKTHLYLAAKFDRKSPFRSADFVGFEFDNDNDGIRENGDDIVLSGAWHAPNVESNIADFYRFNGGAANQSDGAGGGTLDGSSAWGTVGTVGVFELRHDLNSADDAHDFSINPSLGAVTVGMLIQVSLETIVNGQSVFLHTFKPGPTTYCKLTITKKSTSVTCP